MQYKVAAILAASLAKQAIATGWPVDAASFSSPDNCNNQCKNGQESGYDWSSLQPGFFSSYGNNQFSGFSCSNTFGKRDLLAERAFQDKCITGDLGSSPSIFCGSDESMSIDTLHVSTSYDTDVDCVYSMPDGSECHSSHACSAGGSTIQNSQCGGAKSVTFQQPPGSNKGNSSCSIGIHSVGFNCGSASSSSYTASATSPVESSTSVASTSVYTTSSVILSTYSTPSSSVTLSNYGTAGSSVASTEDSPVTTNTPVGYISTSPGLSTYANSSAPAPVTVTTITSVYVTTCPVGHTLTTLGSTIVLTTPSVITTSTIATLTIASSNSAIATPNAPSVLPSCLNTWMYKTGCKGNTDYSCYCKDSTFMKDVYGCISSWSGSSSDASSAASYLMGICAPYVSQNPAIITACPSTITVVPTPAPSGSSSSVVAPVSSGSSVAALGISPVSPASGSPAGSSVAAPGISPVSPASGSPAGAVSSVAAPGISPVSPASGSPAGAVSSVAAPGISPVSPASGSPAGSSVAAPGISPVSPASGSPAGSSVAAPGISPGLPASGSYSSPASPAATSPAPTSAPAYSAPVTTITYSSSVTVPATYSTGQSAGLTIPSSSTLTHIVTTVTVPQVQFTTSTLTVNGVTTTATGLAAGSPSSAPAGAITAGGSAAPSGYAPAYPTTLGTAASASPVKPTSPSSSPIAPFTGAGIRLSSTSFASLAVGLLLSSLCKGALALIMFDSD